MKTYTEFTRVTGKVSESTHIEDHFNGVKFSMDGSLKVQREQLQEWKDKLNSQLYEQFEKAVLASNEGKSDMYSIARGTSLDNWIANWKPGKSSEELKWCLK